MFGNVNGGMDHPATGYMLARMTEGFARGARQIVSEGYARPYRECRATVSALTGLREDMERLRDTAAHHHIPGAAELADEFEESAFDMVTENEYRKGKIAHKLLEPRGNRFKYDLDMVAESPALNEAFQEALEAAFEVMAGGVEYETFRGRWEAARKPHTSEKAAQQHVPPTETPSERTVVNVGVKEAATSEELEAVPASEIVPTFLGLPDRRHIKRPSSTAPLLSEAAEPYFAEREKRKKLPVGATLPERERMKIPALADQSFEPARVRDIKTNRTRLKIFIDLIGDHPVDTYTCEDFQTFVHLMRFYEANSGDRADVFEIDARALFEQNYNTVTGEALNRPAALKTVKNGFVGGVRPIIRSVTHKGRVCDPLGGVPLEYPRDFPRSKPAEPIGGAQMQRIVRSGIEKGLLSLVMMPVVAYLSTRRLGAIVPMRGVDIQEKYQPLGEDQRPVCVVDYGEEANDLNLKTDHSRATFVLNNFLDDIGFIAFARSLGEEPIFSRFHLSPDPNSVASKILNAHLDECGCRTREVFHSQRGDGISFYRACVRIEQAIRHQAGHAQRDEHDRYGSVLTEEIALEFAQATPPRWLEELRGELTTLDFAELRDRDYEVGLRNRKGRKNGNSAP